VNGDAYAEVLVEVERLEAALRQHHQHVTESASMTALPVMVRELRDLDHRVAEIRATCERGRPVELRPTPLM